MNETIIIVGDSPFLINIEDKLSYALEKYESMGINNALLKHNVKYHIFQDEKFVKLSNKYPTVKTISLYMYGDLIKGDKELYDSYAYNFKKDNAKNIIKDRKLAWCGFTHDYAISYCIIKGYSRIILAGAADFIEGKHYSTDEEFRYSEKLKNMSKRFIEEVCSQRASIFTLNPDSFLNIPRITISELLT